MQTQRIFGIYGHTLIFRCGSTFQEKEGEEEEDFTWPSLFHGDTKEEIFINPIFMIFSLFVGVLLQGLQPPSGASNRRRLPPTAVGYCKPASVASRPASVALMARVFFSSKEPPIFCADYGQEYAGVYGVYYNGAPRTTNMIIGCDISASQPGSFTDMLRFTDVGSKCTQDRDARATMYVLGPHGPEKYECLYRDGTSLMGSHYTGPNVFWGTVEYRLMTKTHCGTPPSHAFA